MGSAQPGRPGNLTAEQEVKLQELWTATFHVFGVPGLSKKHDTEVTPVAGAQDPSQAEQRPRASTLSSEKKKTKRISLFGRKHKDESAVDGADASSNEGEDKYGQTKDFHKVIESQSPESLRNAFWSMVKHDNPDALLLRFLRARKWNVQNALVMMISTMNWRSAAIHLDDDIIRRGEAGALEDSAGSDTAVRKEGGDFLAQMRIGKSFLHGTDKQGRPICTVRVRLHKQGDQSEQSVEKFTVYTIETARLLMASNVDTAAVIFDMTDFSMANMDYGPVKFMIKVFEANYPESLGAVLVHKSPWIFHSIWKIIKGWLDPVVASKVHFTKNVEELEEFVERSHIVKELGGDDPWVYHYVEPIAGENILLQDGSTKQKLFDERAATVNDFESTTQQWIHDPKQEPLRLRRADLVERLRTGYWEVDPYLRARTLYDRTGMIQDGGHIQYYPSQNPIPSASNAPVQNGPLPAQQTPDDLD